MKKPVKNQAIRKILPCIIVAVVGFTVWYVWHSKQSVDKTYDSSRAQSQQPATKVYTDTAGFYGLMYPVDWKLTYPTAGSEGPAPDWTKQPRPVVLTAATAPAHATGIQVQVLSWTMANDSINQHRTDKAHTVQALKLNGYNAYYDRLVFTGPSGAEKYTDDSYFIFRNEEDDALFLTFRESYYHKYPAENWNDSRHLADFKAIAASAKFLH